MNKKGLVDQLIVGGPVSIALIILLGVFIVLSATIFAFNSSPDKDLEIESFQLDQKDSRVLAETFLDDSIDLDDAEFLEISELIYVEERVRVRDYMQEVLRYEASRGQIDINEYDLLFGKLESYFDERYSCGGKNRFVFGYIFSDGTFKRLVDYPENPRELGNTPIYRNPSYDVKSYVESLEYQGSRGQAIFEGSVRC